MAPHSSALAWKIPWTEEPGGLQSMGLLGVGHDWATSLSLFTFMHWRRKWQPTPVFLPGESQGREAWWAAVYWVAQGRTRLKPLSSSSRWVKYSSPKWWQLAMFPDIAKCSLEVKNSPLGKHWCRLPYYYMSSKCIYSGNFPCPSIDDWIKKIWVCAWCVCVMEYYSVIQRKILFAAT